MNGVATTSIAELARPPIEPEGRVISDHIGRFGSSNGAEDLTALRARLLVAVRAVCPCWLRDDQEDIVQVAMIAVLKQLKKTEGGRRFPSSYLRKVAYTAMIDEIRRRRSRGEVPLEPDDDEVALVEGHANPERETLAGEISIGIRACLDRLVSPRREAVTLHLLAYKVPRISERMNWKPKRAENLVYRGLDNLRDCLREKGLQP